MDNRDEYIKLLEERIGTLEHQVEELEGINERLDEHVEVAEDTLYSFVHATVASWHYTSDGFPRPYLDHGDQCAAWVDYSKRAEEIIKLYGQMLRIDDMQKALVGQITAGIPDVRKIMDSYKIENLKGHC